MDLVHPLIKEIKQALIVFVANGALMSVSGSTVFGLFQSKKALLRAEAALRAHYPDFIIEVA
jgi:4-diphosphocytidyl-2C-methyl-D-erythritol kinase